ncbi:hypothetical protein [Promineifilum sp.]|uniref:hypothetical protein n=1 Tax=Promineifilum sp. TaxID=2664178 RepID=UPI0035B4BB63
MPRLPLLALAILALLAAIWAGLLRLGWAWPALQPALAAAHGPLMVSAFLGTVISLERAVALDRRAAYLAPALAAAGGLLLLSGLSWTWGGRLLALGSLGLAVLFGVIVRRHPAIYTVVMALGALAWLLGNVLQLFGRPIYAVVPWWVAFLVLTIAGERLELSRVLRLSRRTINLFAGAAGVFLAGVILSTLAYGAGVRLAGLGLVALAAWLLRFDLARRNVRLSGLTRFIAVCLFGGYVWLGVGGALWLIYGGVPAGPIYDAILHTIFLGFVFAMIFGHAPLIFPSVLGRPMVYLPAFYLPLIVLHLSLLLRVAGDLLAIVPLRQWGGLLNGVALLLFLGTTGVSLARGRR